MPHARTGPRAAALVLSILSLTSLTLVVGGCRGRGAAGQPGQAPAPPAQPPVGGPSEPAPAAAEWAVPPGPAVFRARMVVRQTYKAVAGANGRLSWTLLGPRAELKNQAGEVVLVHYQGPGGPVWECDDGSAVMGKKVHERPSPNPGSVPELQLEARTVGGAGLLSNVTLIERLTPVGGVPPADPAPPAYRAGDTAEIRYSAEYVFYAPAE